MGRYLWLEDAPPAEYIRLFFCREVYHCTPSQFMQEDPLKILEDLTMIDIEAKVREREEELRNQSD